MKKDAGEKKLKRKMVGKKKMVVEEKGKNSKQDSVGGLPDESMKRKGVAVLSQQAKKKQQLALSVLASGVTTPLPPPVPSDEAAAAPSVSGQPKDVVLAADFMPLDRPVQNEEALSKHSTKKNKEKKNKMPSLNTTVGTVTSGFLPSRSTSGVLYIGHIPHGFYEDQMRGFFGQFGTIKRLRLSRNKKTGKSKHYAFIEFETPEVAQIVAEAMHNYLLFESMLQVKLVPLEKIHSRFWIGANQKFRTVPWQQLERQHHNRVRTPEEQQLLLEALVKKDQKRRSKILAVGIDYDYPEIRALIPPSSKRITHFEL